MTDAGNSAVEVCLLDARLRAEPELRPQRGSAGAAGLDLRACLAQPLTLEPGATAKVGAGFCMHIADTTCCGMVVPRSGLGSRHGIVLANTIGIIDSDYTGELLMPLWNRGTEAYTITPYERVAQLLFVPVRLPELVLVDEFTAASQRGADGFGSTGAI